MILLPVSLLAFYAVASCNILPMTQIFAAHGIVPDVIEKAPPALLQVAFSGNLAVKMGEELTPTQVKAAPTLVKWDAGGEPGSFYLLCLTDPDAPSREKPTNREFRHWLVGNIPGNDIAKGEVLTGYLGSRPPKDSGLHRYVFLVYKQPRKLTFDETRVSSTQRGNRAKFSIKDFAEKYNLHEPVAGIMYQAEFDDYVASAPPLEN